MKTRIAKDDLYDDAAGRIERYIAETPKVGRTEILRDKRWNLTIIGPEQYRRDILANVAADARNTAASFGTDYRVRIEGLQQPVVWYQKGPLDLALYIPYALAVVPQEK